MTILPLPLSFFVETLDQQHPFSFVRYGDGEWQCILGADGQNCDGVKYSPELAGALANTLQTRGDYFYAMGPKASANNVLAPRVEQWLAENAPRLPWYDSEALLGASLGGTLYPFVHALTQRKVMLVGGAHLQSLPVLKPIIHVETPARDAFAKLTGIEESILKRAERVDVILFAAGPSAKILVHHLHPTLKKSHTLLDIGSLFDMYCGVNSRRYARKMDEGRKQGLLESNFYG